MIKLLAQVDGLAGCGLHQFSLQEVRLLRYTIEIEKCYKFVNEISQSRPTDCNVMKFPDTSLWISIQKALMSCVSLRRFDDQVGTTLQALSSKSGNDHFINRRLIPDNYCACNSLIFKNI